MKMDVRAGGEAYQGLSFHSREGEGKGALLDVQCVRQPFLSLLFRGADADERRLRRRVRLTAVREPVSRYDGWMHQCRVFNGLLLLRARSELIVFLFCSAERRRD